MALKRRVTVTEDEVWAEIDKFMDAPTKDDDEYDVVFFMKKYGLKRKAAGNRLSQLEASGLITSRVVLMNGHLPRVYKVVKK